MNHAFRFRVRLLATLGASLALPGAAWAQVAFPEKGKSITLLVPYGAGGMIDVMGRTLAQGWDAKWGTSTMVVNRPGANGQLAFTEMLRSKRDGYTIAFTHSFDSQMTYLDPGAGAAYSRSDFVPVALAQRTPSIWVVRADSPIKTGKDLVAAALAQPGKVNIGSPAARGATVLYTRLLEERFGARFNTVPFNDVPSTVNALLGGHLDAATSNVAVALANVKAGKLRVIMVNGDLPVEFFPDAPTSASLGMPMPDFSSTGLALAAGAPQYVVDAWAAMIRELTAEPATRARMRALGVTLDFMPPSESARLWLDIEQSVSKLLVQVAGSARTPR